MKRHKCKATTNQPTITDIISTNSASSKVSQADKDYVTRACVDFVCKDLRPFNTIEGDGFTSLVQKLLDLQHKSSTRLDAKSLLPHPTTVSRNLQTKASSVRSSLNVSIQEAFRVSRVSFTSDMWTDNYRQRPYLTLTSHWIDSDWDLVSHVISTAEFDSTLKKTGSNIKAALTAILQGYNITPAHTSRSVYTTDRGSNMILALSDDERIDCIAHILNTVLRNAFDEKKACPVSITKLIDATKGLVRYVKKSTLHNLLSKALVQSCETRWNSLYFMLGSVLERYNEVQDLLAKHAPSEIRRLTAIDTDLLNELVCFLKVFHQATCELEGQSDAAIHLVYPWVVKLKRHCAAQDEDDDDIASIKGLCMQYLEVLNYAS